MTIIVLLSYFIVVMPTGPSNGTVVGEPFKSGATRDEVCAEARKRHAQAWMHVIAYENDSAVGTLVRKPVNCATKISFGPGSGKAINDQPEPRRD